MVRAIRGATTVENNDREEIIEATKEMLETIISENNIKTEDMVSVIFTITPDLDKVFPAVAARKMGIVDVPLLDMSEPEIDGALKKCIRILIWKKLIIFKQNHNLHLKNKIKIWYTHI